MAAKVDDCLFCRIISGEEPAQIVFEDEHCLAFLDFRPLFPGHSLLVPREHHVTLADLPDELLAPLFGAAKLLSRAVPEAMGKPGSFVALNNVVSQSVAHLHVHIAPRKPKDGLKGFFWPRKKYGKGEAERAASAIRKVIERLEASR